MSFSPQMLDVRPALAEGQDPFGAIMQAIGQLGVDQELLLITPFEPTSLYTLLERHGLTHHAERAATNEWRVTVHRTATAVPGLAVQQMDSTALLGPAFEGEASAAQQIIQLDTRGMEPPGPLVRILTALEPLGDGQQLVAHIDREPLLLFPQLLERGWAYEGTPQADGSFLLHVFRPH
jgi:uncharacterized protein (DUF2249 family)